MSASHYDTLGVARTADVAVIKAAYRALSRTHHPDVGGDPERFLELKGAYEVLSNPAKKADYDRVLDDIDQRNRNAGPAPHSTYTPPRPGPRPGDTSEAPFNQRVGEREQRTAEDLKRRRTADASGDQAETERLRRLIDDNIGDDQHKVTLFNELRSQGHSIDDAVTIVVDAHRAATRARRVYAAAGAALATIWGLTRLVAPAVLYAGPSPLEGHVTTAALLPWLAGAGAYGAYKAAAYLDGPVLWFTRRPLPYAGAAVGAAVGVAATAEQTLLNMAPALIVIAACGAIGGVTGLIAHKRKHSSDTAT